MAFNAYDAVKKIAEYKTGWHTSDKAGDRKKADEYAKNAQQYYKQLMDNGYTDVADALKNTNDVGAKYIVDNFMKTYSPPVETSKSSTPTVADTSSIKEKIDDLYGIQRSDRGTMAKKYDTLENYNYNHNPYESEIGKSIMKDYKFQGETASDNATASGGASNGGNIDSYAAANANRQQLAFTNAGKQAVLNDFNTRISNARGILNELGVYQQNQDKGMQTTINQQQTEEQRKFDNDVKTSEVTGYVPEGMSYSNNPFFNKDGSLINPDTTDYSQIITNARNKLKTTTDSAEKANLEATIKYATQARAHKILNMPEYSKWANTMELTSPDETLTSKVTNKELDNDKHAIDTESATSKYISDNDLEGTKYSSDKSLEGTKYTTDTSERISDKTNATNITISENEKIAQVEANPTWREALSEYNLSDNAKSVLALYAYDAWAHDDDSFNVKVMLDANKDKLTWNDAAEIARMYGETKDLSGWIATQNWYNPKAKSEEKEPEYNPADN